MKISFIVTLLLGLLCNGASAQDRLNTLAFSGHYVDFDDYVSGAGFSAGYQRQLNDWLTLEALVSHAGGSTFPRNFDSAQASEQAALGFVSYSKTSIQNAGINLHLSFINSTHHFLSFNAGLGCMFINATDYQAFTENYFNGQEMQTITSPQTLSRQTSYLSKSFGFQYRYIFTNGFTLGADFMVVKSFKSDVNFYGLDNYRAVGVTIGKSF